MLPAKLIIDLYSMKKCPFCAEEINDEAIKCKHCQSDLTSTPPKEVKDVTVDGKLKGFETFMQQYSHSWTLVNKTKTILSYQRVDPAKKGSCLFALILMLILIVPGLLYLYFANKPAKTYRLTVSIDEEGSISASGDPEGIRLYNKFTQKKAV
jgi:hypothetical protein